MADKSTLAHSLILTGFCLKGHTNKVSRHTIPRETGDSGWNVLDSEHPSLSLSDFIAIERSDSAVMP